MAARTVAQKVMDLIFGTTYNAYKSIRTAKTNPPTTAQVADGIGNAGTGAIELSGA